MNSVSDEKDLDLKNFEFFKCLASNKTCAIFPLYSIGRHKQVELKNEIKKQEFGFSEFLSKQINNGKNIETRFLFVYNISKNQVKNFAKNFNLQTIIFKDKTSFNQLRFNKDSESLEVVKVFEAKQIDAGFLKEIFALNFKKPTESFELLMVEPPRPSYFQVKERYLQIF